MELKTLKLLADNGTPLVIRTDQQGDTLLVSREGGEAIGITWDRGEHEPWLETILAHYPREVSLNGRRLETTPAPTAARVAVLEPMDYDVSDQMGKDFRPINGPGDEPLHRQFNALAGGVLCNVGVHITDEERDEQVYLAHLNGERTGHQHHQALRAVRLEAHTVIEADEIRMLGEERGVRPIVPRDRSLDTKLRKQRRGMREHTEALPGMPRRSEGPVHVHPLIGEYGDSEFHEGAPMEVTGRPLRIDQHRLDLTDPEYLSVVDAVNRSGLDLVPVSEHGVMVLGKHVPGTKPDLQVREAEFITEFAPGQENGTTWNRIQLRLVLEDETRKDSEESIVIDARLHMEDEYEDNATCRVVQGQIQQDELQQLLVRAYWQEQDWSSWDEKKYQYEEMGERMTRLAAYTLGDQEGAITAEMQSRVDRIYPGVPVPDHKISVTSWDGRWTLTLNEATECEAA